MTPLLWSLLLSGLGLVGTYLVGQRNYWGWALYVFTEGLWVVYAVETAQWGFIVSAVCYGVLNVRYWTKWRREQT